MTHTTLIPTDRLNQLEAIEKMSGTTTTILNADLHYEGQSVKLMKAKANLFDELKSCLSEIACHLNVGAGLLAPHDLQEIADNALAILTKCEQITKGE
jgi:hypothetical protein